MQSGSHQGRRTAAGLVFQAFLIAVAYYAAYLLRYDFDIPRVYLRTFAWTLPILIVLRCAALVGFGLHRRLWRFSGVPDLIALGWAITLSTVAFGLLIAVLTRFNGYPRSVLIIDLALSLLLSGGARLAARVFSESTDRLRNAAENGEQTPTLIIGAGKAGEHLLRDLQRNYASNIVPVGFVDDDPNKHGLALHGIPVLGGTNDLERVVAQVGAKLIVIAVPSASKPRMLRLVKRCVDTGVRFKVLPSLPQLLDSEGQGAAWGEFATAPVQPAPPSKNVSTTSAPPATDEPGAGAARPSARGAGGLAGAALVCGRGAKAAARDFRLRSVALDRALRDRVRTATAAVCAGSTSNQLARFLKLCVNRDLTRVLYDALVVLGAAAVAQAYSSYFLGAKLSPQLLVAATAVLSLNALFGMYTRLRTSPAATKATVLTASVLLGVTLSATLWTLSAPLVLWTLLAAVPLILPRLLVNASAPVRGGGTGLIRQVMRNRGPVVVVGGAGYIGTHLVEQLLNEGFSVRVIDRLMYGPEPIAEFMQSPKFELIEGDATDIMKLTTALNGASAVVHLGGLVGDPACALDEQFTRHANVIATRMVKEVARSFGIPRFVFASSCSVYGVNPDEVNEKTEPNPVSLYARTKIDSERELLGSQEKDFDVTVLRFATVFGHSRRPRFDLVANLFTAQAMVEGRILLMGPEQWRPFVHVRDLARAIVTVLKAEPEKVRGEIFNVGDKRLNMTIGRLAERVQEHVSLERPVEVVVKEDFPDARNYAVSFDKIQRVLGFNAATLLDDGIQEMVEEFKKGTYGHYKAETYSNVSTTRKALTQFRDPQVASKLYRPLMEVPAEASA